MPLALLCLARLLYALRLPEIRLPEQTHKGRRIDLCVLPPYLRRDIGFDTFQCETREDWRTFR